MNISNLKFGIWLCRAIVLLAGASPVLATTRTVTNLNDSGAGSLRQTIADSANGDTINFSVTDTITLTTGELAIGRSITITGPAAGITISGNNSSRVFHVSNGTTSGPTVILAGLTISNGSISPSFSNGAGVFNDQSTLTLNNCTLSQNRTNFGSGGGIFNSGTLTVTNCTLSGNYSSAGSSGEGLGGGIANSGTATVTNCTLNGGFAFQGGGIYNSGTLTVSNCTLSGNHFNVVGGGIANSGTATVTNCTLSGNSAGSGSSGGGLAVFGSNTITMILNTIIAGNSVGSNAVGPDVDGNVSSQGHNLIGKTDGSSGWVASDLTGTSASPLDPQLGPLQSNGGATLTMALQPTSAAIDAGDDAVLGSPLNLTTDQRGPGFPRKQGTHVDVGAFEFDQPQSGPTFIVTTTDDHDDGICGPVDCTLREAINAANADGVPSTITFAPTVTGTILLGGALPNVTGNVIIQGPGARILQVSGNSAYRPFSFTTGTSTISGLTIRDGWLAGGANASGSGAGVFNQGTLTLTECALTGNAVHGGGGGISGDGGDGYGGAIYNSGMLTLNRCTANGNTAGGGNGANASRPTAAGRGGSAYGSALFNDGGTLTLSNCTIANNTGSGGNGGNGAGSFPTGGSGGRARGGIYNNGGAISITACTFSGNAGTGGNGGSGSPSGTPGRGSGGLTNSGTNVVQDSIIAGNNGNNGGAVDVEGAFNSGGYNLIGNGDFSSGFTATGDRVGTTAAPINPQLGALQNNGGPTDTMALLSGSPAINNGDPSAPSQDQRYYLRNGAPDTGAFEFGATLAPISAVSRKTHGSAGAFGITFPLTGAVGIECRSGGATGDHQLNLSFATPVTVTGSPQAQVTSGVGQIGTGGTSNGGVVTVNGSAVTVPLTNVANAQRIVVTLFGVSDGINTNNVTIPMGVLLGDVNATGGVDGNDVSAVQSHTRQLLNATNFQYDVNVTGGIDGNDVSAVQAHTRSGLP